MMDIDSYIYAIDHDVYNDTDFNYIATKARVEMLYKPLFCEVDESLWQSLYTEIILCETDMLPNMTNSINDFIVPNPSVSMRAYSDLAFCVAKLKYSGKHVFLLAKYQSKILHDILNVPVFKAVYDNDKRIHSEIDESFADYKYAAGESSRMSSRMRTWSGGSAAG